MQLPVLYCFPSQQYRQLAIPIQTIKTAMIIPINKQLLVYNAT